MSHGMEGRGEGSLEAPTRHPINWKDPEFYNEEALYSELERVFDICHGCRRCFNLCNSFPLLFDAVDESETMEVDGVPREVYWDVVDQCYLCDMCFMSKCPYVPPHEWNIDFPHLMLRAKAVKHRKGKTRLRDKILASTDTVGAIASFPIVVNVVNAANKCIPTRVLLEKTLGVHRDAHVPEYHNKTLRKATKKHTSVVDAVTATDRTKGRVAIFTTCYGNVNEPQIGLDLISVFEHNNIEIRLTGSERCCGMPSLELGDLKAVEKAKQENISELSRLIDEGWDIIAPIPSCVLMFKQELPLMFPDDADVAKVRDAIFDPFEYLMLRHKADLLETDFHQSLGTVSYHVACHLRVQNIGMKTRDLLNLIPDTTIDAIERCSGHDGTYAVKVEYHETSMKICRPVTNRVKKAQPDFYTSDCPMAGHQIANGLDDGSAPLHPLSLLRHAYGI